MKKTSTAMIEQSKNNSQQRLTIGLDLGDRNSWYCVLDEVGQTPPDFGPENLNQRWKTIPYSFSCYWLGFGHSAFVR